MSQLNLRKRKRVCYYEPEEPPFDEYIFCTECRDYVYEYCSIHGPLLVVPDDKVPSLTGYPPIVPRAALTIPRVFLHLANSRIPGAGIGVFSTLTLPVGVRFGPYRGARLPPGPGSYYGWQILDANHKPSHMMDARDPNNSNWMRYVNCSRHHSEQNLVAYQYKGQLYYRTVKVIPRFTELLVFYGSEFARELGVDLRHYRAACACPRCRAQQPEKPALIKRRKIQAQRNEKSIEENIAKITPIENDRDALVNTQQNGDNKTESTIQPIFNTPNVSINNKNEGQQLQQKTVFTCDKCKESFKLKTDLEKHVNARTLHVNRTDDIVTKSNTKTKCDKCNKSFETNTELAKHITNHMVKNLKNSTNKYTCKSCNSTFETNSRCCLVQHRKTHTGEKRFKCQHCNYASSLKGNLIRHERTHTGEKPYKCDICDYKAAQSNNLKLHLKSVHAGVKPFKCEHCNYACSGKSHLIRHERTHTGEKPYKCDICGYKAARIDNLKQHLMRRHASVNP